MLEDLKDQFDRGYVFVRFVQTKGGTTLGIRLERDRSDASAADFAARRGSLQVVGTLTLNYENVRCHAAIDLATLRGEGHLEHLGRADLSWRKP